MLANAVDKFAENERKRGHAEGKLEVKCLIARKMKLKGLSCAEIMELTELPSIIVEAL